MTTLAKGKALVIECLRDFVPQTGDFNGMRGQMTTLAKGKASVTECLGNFVPQTGECNGKES